MSAQVTITQLPAAGAITGTEAVPIVQNGQTVQTTTGAISASPSQIYQYLTAIQTPALPNSRYLSGGTGIGLTDNGAQSTFQVFLNGTSGSLEAAGNGMIAKASGVVVPRTITASGSGLSVTNGDGVSGNPTIALAGLSAALAGVSGTGLINVVSGTTAGSVSILGTADQITVANGNASTGSPTISLASNAQMPGTGGMVIPKGTTAQQPAGIDGQFRFNTSTSTFDGYASGTWRQFSLAGGVTSFSAGTTGLAPSTPSSGGIILSGTLNVASGGTGANTLAGVRTAIGAAASGVNTDITALLGLTSPIPVNQGGTGGTTPTSARINLGAAEAGINNDIDEIVGLTTPLAINQGGTAGTTAQAARTNILPSQASATNKFLQSNGTDVSFQDVNINVSVATGTLPIANGGTGATNAPAALVNLNAAGLDAPQTFTSGQRGEITVLGDSATITPDFNNSNNFTVTLGGNRTLANPNNLVAGQSGSIFVVQDATGGRTLNYGSYWDWAGGVVPTLSTGANAVDRIDYIVRSATSIHAVASYNYS